VHIKHTEVFNIRHNCKWQVLYACLTDSYMSCQYKPLVVAHMSVIVTGRKHHSDHLDHSAVQGTPTLGPAVMAQAAKTQQYILIAMILTWRFWRYNTCCISNELSRSSLSKVRALHTHTNRDATECITTLHLLVVNNNNNYNNDISHSILPARSQPCRTTTAKYCSLQIQTTEKNTGNKY